MTLTEVLVVVVVIAVLVFMILPTLIPPQRHVAKINCINNVKQIGLGFRVWEGAQKVVFPMQKSITKGGVLELSAKGNVAAIFRVMSNELSTPKILICPEDESHRFASDFISGFGNTNISYFVGLDADDNCPTSILTGDDNFAINGAPVKSGVLLLSTNIPLAWTNERHVLKGNIGLADGSVQTTTDSSLTDTIINQYKFSSDFTNRFRFAIP
jgi:type II secretory pathway pseudopilin PulG